MVITKPQAETSALRKVGVIRTGTNYFHSTIKEPLPRLFAPGLLLSWILKNIPVAAASRGRVGRTGLRHAVV